VKWLYRNGGKRFFDLILAGAGLCLFALPMAWMAWAIWRESGGPVLFRQKRVGKDGSIFHIWKFRTMTRDEQVTSFGRRLRTTAMDELPQLFNIIKGEMSFVGPRPLIPEELQELNRIPDGPRRFSARPGLAGLAQLYGTKVPSLPERLRWDIAYLKRCSPWLDVWILFKAAGITTRGKWEQPGPKLSIGGAL